MHIGWMVAIAGAFCLAAGIAFSALARRRRERADEKERINQIGKELEEFLFNSLSESDPHAKDEFKIFCEAELVEHKGGYKGRYSGQVALTVIYNGDDTIEAVRGDILSEVADFQKEESGFLVSYDIRKEYAHREGD